MIKRNSLGQFEKQYSVNENFFECIDTEEKAYVLGFLYADGCNYVSKTGQKSIQFTQLEQDLNILDKIRNILECTYPYYTEVQKTNGKVKYILKIFSKKLSDDVYNLGVVYHKSLILKFPDNDIVPENLMCHFIRGYFDGDGCIWSGKPKLVTSFDKKAGKEYTKFNMNTKFTFSGCDIFIAALQDYLVQHINLNKTKLNRSKHQKDFCTMEYSGRGNIKKLYDYMYSSATVFGDRKKQKFEDILCADTKKLASELRLTAETSLES